MDIVQVVALFAAALVGGALNSVAGGGSFFTFPTLLQVGVPEVAASATNTLGLWPATISSMSAYRAELKQEWELEQRTGSQRIIAAVVASLLGGWVGAELLLRTSDVVFRLMIPFLLLFSTLLFAFSPRINAYLRNRKATAMETEKRADEPLMRNSRIMLAIGFILQLMIATYGGFFGAGIGIMMLAVLGLMGMQNIHRMNGVKTMLSMFINGMSMVRFLFSNKIFWLEVIVMVFGSILGGYYGAYYARKIKPSWVRAFVIVVGLSLTIYFFVKTYVLPSPV